MIHRIDTRFLIAEDGRILFRTGGQFVVVPEADLWLVRRRNMQANAIGIAAVVLSNVGWPQTYWRPWWLAVGLGIWFAAYLWVGRWARERYGPTTDPMIAQEIRRAIDRSDPRSIGSEIAAGLLLALLAFAAVLVQDKPRSPWILFLVIAMTHFHGAFKRLRRLNETEPESPATVSR